MNMLKNILKWLIILSLFIFFVSFGLYTSWRSYYGSTDFDTYYYAARDLVAGASVYTEREGVSPYIYPPFFATLIAPLTILNIGVASFVWYLLNLGFFFIGIYLSFLLIFKVRNYKEIASFLPLFPKMLFIVIAAGLFIDNISMLQVNILLYTAMVASLYFFKKRMDILAGLFLGMAISIKIIPVLFLVYFIIKREFKISVLTLAWTAFFSFAAPSFYIGMPDTWQSILMWCKNMLFKSTSLTPNFDMMIYMFNPENQSFTALLSRWLIKNDFLILHFKRVAHEFPPFMITWTLGLTKETTLYVAKIAIFLISAVTLLFCSRRISARDGSLLNHEYSLIFLLSLIANPVLKTQQLVLILFPLVFLLSLIAESGKDYRYVYFAFLTASLLYLAQAVRLCRVFGFGALSFMWLWFVIMARKIKMERYEK